MKEKKSAGKNVSAVQPMEQSKSDAHSSENSQAAGQFFVKSQAAGQSSENSQAAGQSFVKSQTAEQSSENSQAAGQSFVKSQAVGQQPTASDTHESWKPGTMIYPLPAVLISCGRTPEEYNLITISWVGTICSNPPMCYISVRPERHSYSILKESGEFVINLTNEAMAYATDWCGVRSGKNFNKFKKMKLSPVKAEKVNAPIIKESPLCIECRVKEIISLGSHDMFIAEVVNVLADKQYIDSETDKFDLAMAKLVAYSHGHYYKMGEEIGKFGWSVKR